MSDVESTWEGFWKEICVKPDGALDLEQIKKELYDFKIIMRSAAKVYDHITGGRVSNVLTLPEAVIQEYEDQLEEKVEFTKEDDKEAGKCSFCGSEIKEVLK